MKRALLNRSILVVDDSVVQRRHAVALCRQAGAVAVHEAADGVDALAVIDSLDALPGLLIVSILRCPGWMASN
jgi:CheY-like chemotaxis protein